MPNGAEQAAIRMMQEQRTGGVSLREITGNLDSMLTPTKQGGVWRVTTVRKTLARASQAETAAEPGNRWAACGFGAG